MALVCSRGPPRLLKSEVARRSVVVYLWLDPLYPAVGGGAGVVAAVRYCCGHAALLPGAGGVTGGRHKVVGLISYTGYSHSLG
jgi:hypothetical protein